MDKKQERIIELNRQIKITRDALERIRHGCRDPEGVAEKALDALMPLDAKYPLQGLCGHAPPSK